MYLAVAVPLAPALPLLAELLLLIIALGIIYAMQYVVRAFFGISGSALGKLPIVGGWINSGLHSIEKKVTGIMADGVAAVEAEVGATWHQLGRLVDWIGRELRSHSNLIYTLAAVMLGQEWAGALRHAIADLRTHSNDVAAITRAQIVRIIHAEERLRHGIGHDVLPHLRSLDRALDRVRGHDIPALRARARALEDGAIDTFRWIRAHPRALATSAFVGAVAFALQRLGGTWIRCRNWNRIGKTVCGIPFNAIEDVLAASVVGFAVTDLCTFASLAQSAAAAFEPELMALVDVEDALVGCRGASAPPDLSIGRLSLPPVTRQRALAA